MNDVRLRRSTVAGRVPALEDVPEGMIAINHADGRLFIRKTSGVPAVVAVGSGSGGGGDASPSITLAASPPTGVMAGHRWCDSGTGIVYTLLDDGTSAQWVELEARSRIL